jgi:hypothetical protein
MWPRSRPNRRRLLALIVFETVVLTATASAEPPASPADSTKVRTIKIRPQSPEERRDASRHSQLPLTQDPGATIEPNPDPRIVRTIRVPSRSPPQ